MKRAIRIGGVFFVLLIPAFASGQIQQQSPEQIIKRGSEIFAQTCTQSYCHGANGTQGGAPRLAGRGLEANYIQRVVTFGAEGTPMPAWGQILTQAETNAVIMYVQSLNGVAPTRVAPPASLSGEAAKGRDLFSDTTREMGRCSICHRIDGKGVRVAREIAHIPADAAALRSMATPDVVTATVSNDTFPALVVSQIKDETTLYDLTTVPSVLRRLSPASVKLKNDSDWKHSTALGTYSDAELTSILDFLRATQTAQTPTGTE
jgi:mono/diheme cytochrome c family protein